MASVSLPPIVPQAMSAWSVNTRCAPSRHFRDTRVCGHTTTTMHDMNTPSASLLPYDRHRRCRYCHRHWNALMSSGSRRSTSCRAPSAKRRGQKARPSFCRCSNLLCGTDTHTLGRPVGRLASALLASALIKALNSRASTAHRRCRYTSNNCSAKYLSILRSS